MPKINPAVFYLALAAVIWGATVPIMKITLQEIPIFSLIVLRMTTASIFLFPFVASKLKIDSHGLKAAVLPSSLKIRFTSVLKDGVFSSRIKKEDFKLLFLAAFFGTNLNLAFFFYGLRYSQAINASVIVATTPVLTLILAHIYLKEKLSAKLIAGALLAFLGILTIIGIPVFELKWQAVVGDLALLASALAWVGHEIFSKKALKKHPPIVVAFATTVIGAAVFAPLALWELSTNPGWYSGLSAQGILGLLYGIFFSSLIAYTVWQIGLSKTTATQASFIFYLLPVFGIIFSIILLKESFSPILFLGTALVAAGIVLTEYHRKKHPRLSR